MPESNGKLKAVFFDMGSTLLEFENHSWEELDGRGIAATYKFLGRAGVQLPAADLFEQSFRQVLKDYWSSTNETLEEKPLGHILRQVFAKAGVGYDGVNPDEVGRVFYQPIQDQITEYADTLDVLRWLQDKNLALAVVSNSIFPRGYHLEELTRFGLTPFFRSIVFSSDVGRRKPHPEIFQKVLGELSLSPSEVIFVGDRMREDVLGPQELGMRAILKYHPKRDYSQGVTPMAQVKHLSEMLPIIEKHL